MKNKLTILLAMIALASKATVYTNISVPLYHCAGDSISLKFYADGATYNPGFYHYTVCLSTDVQLINGLKIGNYAPIKNSMLDKFTSTTMGTMTVQLPMIADTFYIGVVLSNNANSAIGFYSPSPAQTIIVRDCNVTGVNESQIDLSLSVYPNPATTEININREAIVTVYDMFGKLVLSDKGRKFDVSGLTSGAYSMSLNIEGVIVNRKFLIVR